MEEGEEKVRQWLLCFWCKVEGCGIGGGKTIFVSHPIQRRIGKKQRGEKFSTFLLHFTQWPALAPVCSKAISMYVVSNSGFILKFVPHFLFILSVKAPAATLPKVKRRLMYVCSCYQMHDLVHPHYSEIEPSIRKVFKVFKLKNTVKSRFKAQNLVTKMQFFIKTSLFSIKSTILKESNCADAGHSLNWDFTVCSPFRKLVLPCSSKLIVRSKRDIRFSYFSIPFLC